VVFFHRSLATATTAVGAVMSAASPSCWNLLDTLHSSYYERHRYWECGSGWVSSGTCHSCRRARDHYREAKRSEKRHLRSAPPSLKVLVKTGLRSISATRNRNSRRNGARYVSQYSCSFSSLPPDSPSSLTLSVALPFICVNVCFLAVVIEKEFSSGVVIACRKLL